MALISATNRAGVTLIVIEAIFGFLAVFTVGLRIWARRLRGARLDESDWTCMSALFFALLLLGTVVYDVTQGLGLPMHEVTPQQFANFNKSILVGLFLWTASTTLIRISTLLLYIRVFPICKFMIFCWMFLAFNAAYVVATLIAGLLICRPIDYNWNPSALKGRCGDKEELYLWHGIQNLLYDVIVVLIPMPLLWRLRLPFYRKVSLTMIFAMGLGICAITLSRIIETRNGDVTRITQDYVSVGLLTMLESLLGVINCSLPLLRPVGQKVFAWFGKADALDSGNSGDRLHNFQSIGTKRTTRKVLDPYDLDTNTDDRVDGNPYTDLYTIWDNNSAPAAVSFDLATTQIGTRS